MTSPIDFEDRAPAPRGTRLPSLGSPRATPEYIGQIKEILETLTGSRGGSNWDRAVTFRDLVDMGLSGTAEAGGALAAAIGGQPAQMLTPGALSPDSIESAIKNSAAYRRLMARIGSAEDLASLPPEIVAQLETSIADLARQRQADIQTLQRKQQTAQMSFASQLQEVTAAVQQSSAGVRQFTSSYADDKRAIALAIQQLSAEVDDIGNINVEERLQALADSVMGLQAQYTIKIQANPVNGKPVFAGIDLAVTSPIDGPGTSSILFLAEEFAFVTSGGEAVPFSIAGSRIRFNGDVVINGKVVLGAGVPLDPSLAAPGTLNSDLTQSISAAQASATAAASLNLIARGACSVLGNTATKALGSSAGWNSDVFSKEGYAGGAAAKVTIPKATGYDMFFGLNSDPAADGSYTSIDIALHITGSGTVEYWESGSFVSALGSMGDGDVLEIVYNGSRLRCTRNGLQMRDVALSTAATLYFDSSFSTPGATMTNIRFTPMSSNAWVDIGGTGKPQDNATVGAPAGTYVGGSPAQSVSEWAAAGANAYAQIPGLSAEIGKRLQKDANDTISGRIALQSQFALLVGDANNGVWMGSGGIFMVQGGVVKASLPISGNATFAGQLLAAFGSFGSITVAPGGSISSGQTAFHTGVGWWFGLDNGVPKFSIGYPGVASLRWDGTQLIAENLSAAMTPLPVSITTTGGNLTTSYSKNASVATTVVGYVNVSGGSGSYTYSWSISADGYPCWLTNPGANNCAGAIKGPGIALPDGVGFVLSCIVTDTATGRSGQAYLYPTIIFS